MEIPITAKLTTETQRLVATIISATEFCVSIDLIIENDNRKIVPLTSNDSKTNLAVIFDPMHLNLEPERDYTGIYRCNTENELRDIITFLAQHQELFKLSDTDPYDVNPEGIERYNNDADCAIDEYDE